MRASSKVWLSPSLVSSSFEYCAESASGSDPGSSAPRAAAWAPVVGLDGRLSEESPLLREISIAVEEVRRDATWVYVRACARGGRRVTTSTGGLFRCPLVAFSALPAVDERCFLAGTADLTLLDREASLCDQMQLLRERFESGSIYTRVGPVDTGTLISINPCTGARIGGAASATDFMQRAAKLAHHSGASATDGDDAHLFGTLAAALLELKATGRSQAVVFTGESGSGKTFAATAAVDFLVQSGGGGGSGSNGGRIGLKLRAACALLHAFCQAPTSANETASRGGRSTRLFFQADGTLIGAAVEQLPVALDAVTRAASPAAPRAAGAADGGVGAGPSAAAPFPRAMRILLQLVWAAPLSTDGALGDAMRLAEVTAADLQRSPWVALGAAGARKQRIAGRLRTDWLNTRDNFETLGVGEVERCALLRALLAAVCLGNIRFVGCLFFDLSWCGLLRCSIAFAY